MEFRLLGPFAVVTGEREVALPSARQRTILAVLLAADGQPVSADRLIDALWGATPPSSAIKTLRSHVSQLRRDLGALEDGAADVIVTEGGGYRLDLTGHRLDAACFEQEVTTATTALADEPRYALELLERGLGRWRGAAFDELADHEAVRPEAVRLERLRAAAAADRVDAQLALGQHQQVVAELEARVDAQPLDERSYGQLMVALHRGGQQVDALATYRRLQQRLRDELGLDPSPHLQRLHQGILRQDAQAPGDLGPTPMAAARQVSELIGRKEEIASVASLVADNPLVTLTGPGGVGKTRLAEQVATEVAGDFDDGVTVCTLSAVRDPEAVGPALVDALGVEHSGRWPVDEVLVAALGSRRLLLVLDNCEHLLGAVGGIVEVLLRRCEDAAVLATSRERLHLPGERVWQVAPLSLPRVEADAKQVVVAPAGALFVARAQAADPDFELTDANAEAVAELCRRLDGLPLAIELAAARVRALAPDALLARLDQRFSLLAGGPHREEGRHRTLQGLVAWSYELLDEPEARLFDRLSVFADRFSLPAAEQVCAGGRVLEGEVAGLLAELIDKSMVSVERADGAARYR
ncbi:MAG: BTAD domain-containing putative transcriptional regulator, partial [Nitriliruptoraceae bacterium]